MKTADFVPREETGLGCSGSTRWSVRHQLDFGPLKRVTKRFATVPKPVAALGACVAKLEHSASKFGGCCTFAATFAA